MPRMLGWVIVKTYGPFNKVSTNISSNVCASDNILQNCCYWHHWYMANYCLWALFIIEMKWEVLSEDLEQSLSRMFGNWNNSIALNIGKCFGDNTMVWDPTPLSISKVHVYSICQGNKVGRIKLKYMGAAIGLMKPYIEMLLGLLALCEGNYQLHMCTFLLQKEALWDAGLVYCGFSAADLLVSASSLSWTSNCIYRQ